MNPHFRILAKRLTAQFYEWERLGRGWILGDSPVDLEPPFTPFFKHQVSKQAAVYDDGVRHTMMSKIASLFRSKNEAQIIPLDDSPTVSYDPYLFQDDADTITRRLHIPKAYHQSTNEVISFLCMLSYCTSPISIEIVADAKAIAMQINCREQYMTYVEAQLRTYFPSVSISDAHIELTEFIDEELPIAVTDFGLCDEFMRPISQYNGSAIDTLQGLFSSLEYLQDGQRVIFQVLFNGIRNPWAESVIRSVSDGKHGAFFEDAPEMLPMAKEKIGSLLFAVSIRLLTQCRSHDETRNLFNTLSFAIIHASRAQGNALMTLYDDNYSIEERVVDIALRESHRVGMLLNVKELATFAHIPIVQSKKLLWKQRKTKTAPTIAIGHPLVLGANEHEGKIVDVSISNEQRLKHTQIIGATGTGKSTLVLSMIVQDITQGNGVAVLDPHGDLIESILNHIPESRMKDVIIVDPADSEYPVGFNILHAHSDIEKEILSSDLVASFKRNSTSWGDQMNSVFGNALLAILESKRGGTLADLRRFLIEKNLREEFLKTVSDPGIRYYWQKEFPLLKTSSIGPILTRLDTFLRPKLIRNMVCQQQGLNFEAILNSKKILLVKLSQGLIGVENSYLLGSFVVSKIHQAALARQATQVRNDFFFYIDEFQHFITPSMAGILSGARKYRLGLILAHQDMVQLQKQDSEVASSVIANAGTRICFRVGENDAKKLGEGLSYFEAKDLQNLGVGEAIARIERPEFDFSFDTTPIKAIDQGIDVRDRIISHSREQYATSKIVVEEYLAKTMQVVPVEAHEEKPHRNTSTPIMQPEEKREVVDKKIQPSVSVPESVHRQADPVDIPTAITKKEETQHRYLQTLIKKMAEAREYKATIEHSLPDGSGKVDVLLEKDNKTIACEVSVTTDASWEIHNIQKCLAAGYDVVVSCMTDKKAIVVLQRKIAETFTLKEIERIRVFEPEALFNYLDSAIVNETPTSTETIVKGYRVKVSYDSVTSEEMKRKRDSVAKIVVDSLKKMKK